MATTRERLDRSVEVDDLRRSESPVQSGVQNATPVEVSRAASPDSTIAAWRWALFAAWATLMVTATIFGPTPSRAPVPLWAELLSLIFTVALLATFYGLASGRLWAFGASAATAVFGVGMAAACGITDHHPGAWWAYEVVATAALVSASFYALRAARR